MASKAPPVGTLAIHVRVWDTQYDAKGRSRPPFCWLTYTPTRGRPKVYAMSVSWKGVHSDDHVSDVSRALKITEAQHRRFTRLIAGLAEKSIPSAKFAAIMWRKITGEVFLFLDQDARGKPMASVEALAFFVGLANGKVFFRPSARS